MATGVISWSQTAASNNTADSTVNWNEGQAPSTVNDSARAMMASVAKWRDDIAGSIATGGTSTAYTVSSNQGFTALSAMHNQLIAFTPHTTNGATVTLNVDSLGAKPLRSGPGVELTSGTIIQGTPYLAFYNNTDGAFYLHGFIGGNQIPLGASIDYWGTSAPSSSYALMYGQAISRTTYASLFALLSTTFGTGDGSTTFNLPDCRGRVIAGKDDMGGSTASRLVNIINGTILGNSGGADAITLTAGQIPTITSAGSMSGTSASSASTWMNSSSIVNTTTGSAGVNFAGGTFNGTSLAQVTGTASVSGSVTSNNTGGAAHGNLQPTIIANKLIRVL